jgi:hypothetical protein
MTCRFERVKCKIVRLHGPLIGLIWLIYTDFLGLNKDFKEKNQRKSVQSAQLVVNFYLKFQFQLHRWEASILKNGVFALRIFIIPIEIDVFIIRHILNVQSPF